MNPSLIWIAAALLLWGMGEGMFYIFQPFYLTELGANPLTIGYILGAAGIATTIGHIPAGYLSDRIGPRSMLIAAWLCGVVATWIMALAPGLPVFIAGLLLYSLTIFVSSPLSSYLTTARGAWSVGRTLTLSSTFYNLGMVLGPFTGGLIAQNFGLHRVYFVSGVLFIISTCFVFMIAPQQSQKHIQGTPQTDLLRNRRYLGFLGLGFVVMLAMYFPQPFTAKFLQDVRGLSFEQVGLMGTIGGLGNTVLTYFLGSLDARLGFIVSQVCVAISSGLIWQMGGFGWIGISYFLLGGYRAARSLYTALIRPLVSEAQMGLAYGLSETIVGVATMLAPIMAGFLYQQNKSSIYPPALAAILLGIFLSLNFAPQHAKTHPQPATTLE
ncbi:MAG TPA: MFS transporter [Anaerolineales bacterium]|jgi:predicted MFS family arabinose efflux permease